MLLSRHLPLLGVLLFVACDSDLGEVELSGRLTIGAESGAPGLAAAELDIYDIVTGERLGQTTADDEGLFALNLPVGLSIGAVVRSPETVTTSFVGVTGFSDFVAEDGTLYGLAPEVVAEWRSAFEGCPSADAPVVVLGRMEFVNLTGTGDGSSPIASGGRASVFAEEEHLACYLDAQGVYDPVAERTGETGRFAVFDVPSGEGTLDVIFEWAPKEFESPGPITLWVPDTDEEVVVPYLPLRLEFPL